MCYSRWLRSFNTTKRVAMQECHGLTVKLLWLIAGFFLQAVVCWMFKRMEKQNLKSLLNKNNQL